MTTSSEINEIAAALAKAQAEMEGAKRESINPFFAKAGDSRKGAYADLASVREACVPALTKHGIAVIQSPSAEGAVASVVTMLVHASGQWFRGVASCTAKDDSPQSIGSATTYLRRYALQSFSSVAPEDDDAEGAQRHGQAAGSVTSVSAPPGYGAWLMAFSRSGEGGIDALRAAWKAADPAYRDYLTASDATLLNKLSAAALAVTSKAATEKSAATVAAVRTAAAQ